MRRAKVLSQERQVRHSSSSFFGRRTSFRLGIDRSAQGDHAAMAIDFKGEGELVVARTCSWTECDRSFILALTFKATTDGVIHNLAFCIEMMQKRDDVWRKKYDKELERRKKFQDLYTKIIKQKIPALGSPDAEVISFGIPCPLLSSDL
jgi:hypothetical protein